MIHSTGQVAAMGTIFNGDPFMVIAYVRRVEAFMGNLSVDNTSFNLLDFMVHLSDDNYKKLHPDRAKIDTENAASSNLNGDTEAKETISTNVGREKIPDEPKDISDSASAKAIAIRQKIIDTRKSIKEGTRKTLEFALSGLSSVDKEALCFLGDGVSLSGVGIEDVISYVISTYKTPNSAQINARKDLIREKFDRTVPLRINLARKMAYNQSLKDVAEAHAFSPASLFLILLELCRDHSQRLYDIVGLFEIRSDYDCNTAKPKDFIDFIVAQNARIHHKPGSGHLVFSDEVGYVPPGSHPLALSASAGGPAPADLAAAILPPPALALAATPAPTFTHADIATLVQTLVAQSLASPPRAGGRRNTQPKRCKFCFACGFQRDHNSKSCPKMANDPSYTDNHRNMVYFPRGTNPMVDGKKANLSCAPGCVPHE